MIFRNVFPNNKLNNINTYTNVPKTGNNMINKIHIKSEDKCLLVRTIFKIIKTDRMCNTTSINTKEEVSHLNNVKYNPTSSSAIITNGIILPNHIFNFIQSTHFCIE